jgi:hypothetical protein
MQQSMKYIMLPLLLMLLDACSPEVPADEIETPSEQIAEQAQDVATPEPTQTPAPAPTRTPFPALPITMEALGGNWMAAGRGFG